MLALCLCLSVCHKSVFCRNGWTDRTIFLTCRLHSTSHTLCCKKIYVSTKITALPSGTLSHTPDFKKFCFLEPCLLEKGGRSERDKVDRRRSAKLTISQSSDSRPLQFTTVIVKLCIQQDTVARVN